MKKHILFSAVLLLSSFASANLIAQNRPSHAITNLVVNDATNPAPRDANLMRRHEGFVEEAKRGGIDLLFLGDSITDGWRGGGKAVWDKYYASRHAANFGIGGDRTQHVLWRIEHGEVDGIKPRVVALMIGTNNTKQNGRDINTVPDIVQDITVIVEELRARLPESKILLLAIFPRGEKGDPIRDQIKDINTTIAKLDNGRTIKYLDIGPKFLEPDGTLPRDMMPDLLHPNAKGYQIWADAIEPTLVEMMK